MKEYKQPLKAFDASGRCIYEGTLTVEAETKQTAYAAINAKLRSMYLNFSFFMPCEKTSNPIDFLTDFFKTNK